MTESKVGDSSKIWIRSKEESKTLVLFLGDSVDYITISQMGNIRGRTEESGGKNYNLEFGHK